MRDALLKLCRAAVRRPSRGTPDEDPVTPTSKLKIVGYAMPKVEGRAFVIK